MDFKAFGGITEIASQESISKQYVNTLRNTKTFPDPVATFAMGSLWDLDEVRVWFMGRARASSRRKIAP